MAGTDIAIIKAVLAERFGEEFAVDPALPGLSTLAGMARHRVCRAYRPDPVDAALLRLVIACALSAPTKSDLQQCDILILRDAAKRARVATLLPEMPWLPGAPEFLVFLANGRRIPMISQARGRPFPNDHLDLFFNAVADTAIVLSAFVTAAEAAGLGCCPISVIRNHAAEISAMLDLPDKVIPVAGLCVGWPAQAGELSPRLSLSTTVHVDRYDESNAAAEVDAYDRRRAALHPYRRQRDTARFGEAAFYGWSEDKARQYADPARADFGAFVRRKGFRLD